jgi:hypothetical protein
MVVHLPENVLLNIFDLYRLDEVDRTSDFPWNWHRLAHVCRTWRDILFASPRYLNLELLCAYWTPTRKNLGYLPPLPIVISSPGIFKDSDEDNILAALEHPDRVRVVELSVPRSLLEKMVTVTQEPFPALTRLWLASNGWGYTMPALPDTFLGGHAPCLQKIHLDGIPFPAAPALLLSARDLVVVELRQIPSSGYISPGEMVTSLATLPRLKQFTFTFLRGTSRFDRILQPPITLTVLPALTTFDFGGHLEYLEDFVAQIDAPQLNHLCIEYFYRYKHWWEDEVDFQTPQLCQFIDRSGSGQLSRFRRAFLEIDYSTVTIELDGGQSSFKLSIQNTGIYQVLSQIPNMLLTVDRLFINPGIPGYSGLGHNLEWLELLYPFTTVKALIVQEEISQRVAIALRSVTLARAAEVLPALEILCLENRRVTSVKEFVDARRIVCLPVTFISKGDEFRERLKIIFSECSVTVFYSIITWNRVLN